MKKSNNSSYIEQYAENNLKNIINIYDDWSADGSVNNMTIRDFIINYVAYGT